MTRNYLVALALIATLSLGASVLLGLIISTQESNGVAINISGRQRMLSQRIALLSLKLALAPDSASRRQTKEGLESAIEVMTASHADLTTGGGVESLPKPSTEVEKLYFSAPVNLNDQVNEFLARARTVADTGATLAPDDPNVEYLLRASNVKLLSGLNRVVSQYERESEVTVSNLEVIVTLMLMMILLLLVAEAVYMFNPMIKTIGKQTDELEDLLKEEHHIAATLQRGLAPREIPKIAGLEIELHYQSATSAAEVGGDFYDFFELPMNRWGIVMGDVEGHGIDAATETAKVKYLLRDRSAAGLSPPEVMRSLNQALVDQKTERFTALTYAIYEPDEGRLTFTNAANPYPYFAGEDRFIETTGMPMGIMPDQSYEVVDVLLKDTDIVLFYTDGLVEARKKLELFERERIRLFVRPRRSEPLSETLLGLVDKAQAFAGGRLTDDILVIGLRKTVLSSQSPSEEAAEPDPPG